MRCLFVVPYTPTLIRTRPYNLLRTLVRRGHQVTLAALWESEVEHRALRSLADAGLSIVAERLSTARRLENSIAALASVAPLQARYCWQPALARRLTTLLASDPSAFDVIHVEHLRGAAYARYLQTYLHRAGLTVPVVWDSVDCISLLFEQAGRGSRSRFGQWMARLELPRTRRYEGRLINEFDRVLVTSPKDQAALERLAALARARAGRRSAEKPPPQVQVLPNGVDLEYFAPERARAQPQTILFSGKMSYHANVTAALHLVEEIMPQVWAQQPSARVVIAGSAPRPEVRALAERHGPRVSVTGYVPDLRPYLHASSIAVAPVAYGAGIQNKVLEAMACGLPVVASPQASSALQTRAGHELLVADTPPRFAEAILQLLAEPALCQVLGERGRRYTEQHHDWRRIAERLEQVYAEASDSRFA